MGILNVTPDSFSDGGDFFDPDRAVDRAMEMEDEGAAIVDVGGESTRPGASPVPVQEEVDRVVPVIEAIVSRSNLLVSVDTCKPSVMREATRAGAVLINDVMALQANDAVEIARDSGAAVCLMHMQGGPGTMQDSPAYDDVTAEVRDFLDTRVSACAEAGIGYDRILVDPGFGFGKTTEHNYRLLGTLDEFRSLGVPLLVGLSRKRMLGAVTRTGERNRTCASVAAAVVAVLGGARLVRVHDVGPTVQAVAVAQAAMEGAG
ncbi:MAG: dihydropteroate synthase [Pseudomonadota bacterium]|nr:dihydropteroate synthase [Pseudomonadota bacterium]